MYYPMYAQVYLQTVVSEFTNRFLQPERASIVPLVTGVCYFVALVMLAKLAGKLQRGEAGFNMHFWRWGFGIVFVTLFPNVLSQVLLHRGVTEVVATAPLQPTKTEGFGHIDPLKTRWLITQGEEEKNAAPPLPSATGLEPTITNPSASPGSFGTDLKP